jgi:hypothetical protein
MQDLETVVGSTIERVIASGVDGRDSVVGFYDVAFYLEDGRLVVIEPNPTPDGDAHPTLTITIDPPG